MQLDTIFTIFFNKKINPIKGDFCKILQARFVNYNEVKI